MRFPLVKDVEIITTGLENFIRRRQAISAIVMPPTINTTIKESGEDSASSNDVIVVQSFQLSFAPISI